MISLKFKEAIVDVEYISSFDDIEVVNVFYKDINVNELFDEADQLAIYERVVEVLEDIAIDAELERMCY